MMRKGYRKYKIGQIETTQALSECHSEPQLRAEK